MPPQETKVGARAIDTAAETTRKLIIRPRSCALRLISSMISRRDRLILVASRNRRLTRRSGFRRSRADTVRYACATSASTATVIVSIGIAFFLRQVPSCHVTSGPDRSRVTLGKIAWARGVSSLVLRDRPGGCLFDRLLAQQVEWNPVTGIKRGLTKRGKRGRSRRPAIPRPAPGGFGSSTDCLRWARRRRANRRRWAATPAGCGRVRTR